MSLIENGFSGRSVRNSHGHVVEVLGRAIVRGEIAVGESLPGDAELLARFHVSRTVIREAIKTLTAKGLIVSRTKVGTSVRERVAWNLFDPDVLAWHVEGELSQDVFQGISEVRLALEPYAALLAAERATIEDIARLKTLARKMADANHTAETLALADLQFHLAVADSAKNPFIRSVGSLVEAALLASFRMSSAESIADRVETISENHMAIVIAIERRDRKAAFAAMEKVINIGIQRVGLEKRQW